MGFVARFLGRRLAHSVGACRAATLGDAAHGGQRDVVGVTERQSGAIGGVDDSAVGDAEVVEPRLPALELRSVVAAEGDVVKPGTELVERLRTRGCDVLVDAERLRYRQAYAVMYQQLIEEGIRSGDFAPQNATVSAAALVGAIPEALVGPLSWQQGGQLTESHDQLIQSIQGFCLRALGAKWD